MIEYFPPKHPGGNLVVFVSAESQEIFKEMVFRATNLWPDAPPSIKMFADLLHHGRVLQNYEQQDTSKRGAPELTLPPPYPTNL